MNEPENEGAEQAPSAMTVVSVMCGATILGPRAGGNVVMWRKKCWRMTRDLETGRCPDHHGVGPFGPGARR